MSAGDVHQVLEECGGNKTEAARRLGIPRSTLRSRLASNKHEVQDMEVLRPADPDMPAEELVELRKRRFERRREAEEQRKLIPVRVKDRKPIGLVIFGDPHVDDDGTDIAMLERDATITRETDGLYGINVGDVTNNWVGRLARLYSEQATTASEAWVLAEWFINLVPWLAVIGGNHDVWSGAGDPLRWICRRALYEPASVRLGLEFPNGRQVRFNARHDFRGSSQWNPAHGAMKATQMGWRDHLMVCGHTHQTGYGLLKCPSSGVVSHAVQVASYKIYDRYAKQLGLPDQNVSPCAVAVIRPEADERGLVTVFHDIEAAADWVKFLRR